MRLRADRLGQFGVGGALFGPMRWYGCKRGAIAVLIIRRILRLLSPQLDIADDKGQRNPCELAVKAQGISRHTRADDIYHPRRKVRNQSLFIPSINCSKLAVHSPTVSLGPVSLK